MSAPQDSQQAPDDAEQVPVVTAADGRRFVPVMTQGPASSTSEETDTVLEALAGNYTQDVVDEVRQYGKPEWEVTESSTLDPIDDIETMYAYDFKLPPKVHDQYVGAAAGEIKDLENMKGEVDPETLAKYEQRRKLTEGRHAEDIKWMKHKAYYRGMQKIRAVKKQLQQAAEEDAQDATADSSTTAAHDSKHQQQPAVQQPQQRLSHYSEAEVLAEISDPSEWDQSWVSPSYQQHPEVLQQLRSSFAKCFDLPYVSPQQQQEQELQLQQALAAQQAAKQRAAELERAKEAFLAKHSPYQAYTPDYQVHLQRQQQAAAYRRHKQQAFWLSLGLAVGSSAVRWLRKRKQQQQQQLQRRRAGSVSGSSRRSTRPPTPVMMLPEAIAE